MAFGSKFLVFITGLGILFYNVSSGFAQEKKEPNVAGSFYPQNSQELSETIDSYIAAANPLSVEGDILVLISPHAGYSFSGQVASFGYKLLKDKPYKTVIVIGSSHYYPFSGISVYPKGVFKTPLGGLEVDSDFASGLLNKDPDIIFEPLAFEKEHSVEVQLPFVQKAFPQAKIVPVIMGDCSFAACKKLSVLLKETVAGRKDILVIASSDMYHGYDYQEAEEVDKRTLAYIKSMDAQDLYSSLREGKTKLCGGFPVLTALLLAKDLGYDSAEILTSTNSARVAGRMVKGVWTVGYCSAVIYRPFVDKKENTQKGENQMLNPLQRKRLAKIARDSIQTYLKTGKNLEVEETDPLLLKTMGAFVTLQEHGQLRGCIGNIVGTQPLYLTVRDMAVEAAVGDPRFSPLKAAELKDIEIEISVLSPLEKVKSADDIQLGRHGVLIKKGFSSGVFLPQVATETGWSKEEFLSVLCTQKAGLPVDAWKDKSTELYVFSAEVFAEKDYP